MKKLGLIVAAALCLSFGAAADEEWDVFSITFTEEVPGGAASTPVYGVKVGAPISAGEAPVSGVEASVLLAGTDKVNGFKGSLAVADGKEMNGLQLSVVNFGVRVNGVQLGIVNIADESAFQIGVINIIKNSPVVALPVLNVRF